MRAAVARTRACLYPSGVPNLRTYLKERLPLLLATTCIGLGLGLGQGYSATQDEEGLLTALSEQVGGETTGFVWEPSRGPWIDLFFGRPLLFEARDKSVTPSAQRDIFRTLVRVSPGGKVLALRSAHNLTNTTKADEQGLKSNGAFAVWSSRAENTPPSLSVVRFDSALVAASPSWLDRIQVGLSRWIDTGTWSGLSRMDVIAPTPGSRLELSVTSDALELTSTTNGQTSRFELPLEQWRHAERLTQDDTPEADGARWVPREHAAIPWVHFFANTLRKMWGATFVARLETLAFSLRDRVLRTSGDLLRNDASPPSTPDRSKAPSPPPSPKKTQTNWPPRDLSVSSSHPSDGHWEPWTSELLPKQEVPLFYRTVIHPDETRPYAEFHLVAFDMRRLELGMRAGYEDPEPDTGPPGSGHVPFDLAEDIVATFNGAFKSTHGHYGMKAEGRLLNEAVEGAATVRVDPDGRVGMGTWTANDDVAQTRSFRQNLDPLIERGKVNPKGRTTWGEHVDATGVAIERSALCLHESGHLIYIWATEATGETLAKGLEQAGCRYGMHLDMNPGHCTFALNRIESVDPLRAEGELLDPRMKANEIRYVRWSPKDFFYLALRDEGESVGRKSGLRFAPDVGTQPSPASIPGIFSAQKTLGPLTVELLRIPTERVSFHLVPGSGEARAPTAVIDEPDPAPYPEALVALGLGHRTHGVRAGLSLGEKVIVPHSRGYGTLLLSDKAGLSILPPGEPVAERQGQVALQLPALARDGEMLDEAKELGGRRNREALCIDEAGAFYFGSIEHDSIAPLVQSLLDVGCTLILEADRGSKSPTYLARAETDVAPQIGFPQTVLYALDREMAPYTYHF